MKADWLTQSFNLSKIDSKNIIGTQSYLYRFYQYFKSYLKFTFKCYDDLECLDNLVYQQLFDGSVTKTLNIENLQSLNLLTNSTYYPFIKTPEIKNFFEKDFKEKMKENNNTKYENMTFEEMEIDLDTVKSLILGKNTTLLKTQNAIDFIFFNYTKNLYTAYLKFNIQTLDQLVFFAEYFVSFIPDVYYYPAFINTKNINNKTENNIYKGNRISNALISLIPIAINNSVTYIKDHIENVVLNKIVYENIKSEENQNICQTLFAKVIKNNLSGIDKICSNEDINLGSLNSVKKWIYISDCLYSYCKEEQKNELKMLTGLNEVREIFLR